MVIPGRDASHPASTFPIAVATIVALNVVMFLVEVALGTSFVERFALKPDQITNGHQLETLFTSMFMHASLIHIAGNMVFLVAFGVGLEANFLGSLRFLGFYLLCGLCASALQIAVDPSSTALLVGASGAIAGVMGGYMVVFPSNQMMMLLTTPFGLLPTRVTAGVYIGIWFLIQLISGVGSIGDTNDSGVAYFAHIGGFLAGVLLILLFSGRDTTVAT